MSLLDDITGAVSGLMNQLPELTASCVTSKGDSVTVIFTSNFIAQTNTDLGILQSPNATFKLLQANVPSSGMANGDTVTLTDSQNRVSTVRILSTGSVLNFVTFTVEAVNK